MLDGKKTHLTGGAILAAAALWDQIPGDLRDRLILALGALALMAIRVAISKLEKLGGVTVFDLPRGGAVVTTGGDRERGGQDPGTGED